MSGRHSYPDIGDIIARKARGRGERARLSFGEKLEILDKLRDDVASIALARRARTRIVQEKAGRATKPTLAMIERLRSLPTPPNIERREEEELP